MADIELVIKIDEKLACEGFERPFTEEEKSILIKAIGNGTPLKKRAWKNHRCDLCPRCENHKG